MTLDIALSVPAQGFIALCYICDGDPQEFVAFQGHRLGSCILLQNLLFLFLFFFLYIYIHIYKTSNSAT